MSEKNVSHKPVFALTERADKTFWTRVGIAFENKDRSITIQLDALPVSGRLQIREHEDREERQERGGRAERRGRSTRTAGNAVLS